MFRSTFFTLFWFVVVVQALPIEYDLKRDIYLTLPSSSKAAEADGAGNVAGQSSLYTLGDGQVSSAPAYVTTSSPMIMAPATTTAQDPTALWTVPMIPSGQFSPMPNIVHHVVSTIAIPQSQAEKPKEGEKKEGEPPKPEEPKPEEGKPAEPKPEEPKPAEPKPEEPKPAEPKPEEPKPEEPKKEGEPKPADPPKARRSLRGSTGKQIVKRQEDDSGTCASEQYIVPVTYTELQGLNEGTLKLQRLGSDSSPEEGCDGADVIVAPVSDEQMEEIQAGTLQLVPLDEPGQVSLEPVVASTGDDSDTAASGNEKPESGPMYDVIPTTPSLTDEEVQDVVQDFTAGKNLLDQQYQSEADDVRNIAGSLKSQGKSIIGDDQDIHITLRRRDHMIYVERKPQAKRSVEGVYR
ncbi:uncharacterized protein FA14DRAFT_21926 [Meira miltonrushii]|uniref:Uncharacterized protein n=1 Tax=Meira miltonrushii TaxID=1280837 RepID=A0A316VNK8_9BASI|nr:uncharacterized protein FA14DRAFT_21926 [Meira miltonrushii]PWN38003.1 hypothetical protein FA14DRAFT_21926 [Meira miltonrushii]